MSGLHLFTYLHGFTPNPASDWGAKVGVGKLQLGFGKIGLCLGNSGLGSVILAARHGGLHIAHLRLLHAALAGGESGLRGSNPILGLSQSRLCLTDALLRHLLLCQGHVVGGFSRV